MAPPPPPFYGTATKIFFSGFPYDFGYFDYAYV